MQANTLLGIPGDFIGSEQASPWGTKAGGQAFLFCDLPESCVRDSALCPLCSNTLSLVVQVRFEPCFDKPWDKVVTVHPTSPTRVGQVLDHTHVCNTIKCLRKMETARSTFMALWSACFLHACLVVRSCSPPRDCSRTCTCQRAWLETGESNGSHTKTF